MKNKKIVVFGYGYWGQKVVQALSSNNTLIVVEPDTNKHVSDLGIDFVQANEVTYIDDITHAFISTPEQTHYQLTKEYLHSGKHVFVEKPLCLNGDQAREVCTIAQKQQQTLFVDYIFLYDPFLQKIHSLLQQKRIGELIKISSRRLSKGFYKPAVTVFDDLAMHDLYIGRYLTASICLGAKVSKLHKDSHTITAGQVNYQFGEVAYDAYYKWSTTSSKRVMTITGTKGKITWDKESQYLTLETEKGTSKVLVHQTQQSPLELSIQHFLDLCDHEDLELRKKRYQEYIDDVTVLESIDAQARSSL